MTSILPHALFVGVVTAAATHLAGVAGVPAWVMFIPWAAYFLVGATLAAGIKMYASMACGIGLGMVATLLSGLLAPALGSLALPAIVVGIAGGLTFCERVPALDCIPAYYLGIVTYFASGREVSVAAYGELVLVAAAGVVFGAGIAEARTWYERRRVRAGA